jgi:hypothetical protein
VGAWYRLGEVLMQAELTINTPGGGGGIQPPTVTRPLTFGRGRVAGNKAILPLTCALDTTCAGLLRLLRRAGATAKKRKKTVVYGRTRFSVPAHKTRRVKVKLTKAGKKLLRRRKSARMLARATIGSQVATGTVTIRRK